MEAILFKLFFHSSNLSLVPKGIRDEEGRGCLCGRRRKRRRDQRLWGIHRDKD